MGNAVRVIFSATNDLQWMKDYGCDLAIGTAEFWASLVTFNESTKRYDINGVIGPDEDHIKVNNNPFTNVAAALNLFFGSLVCFFNHLSMLFNVCVVHAVNTTCEYISFPDSLRAYVRN